jgi:hypothetical protein
MVMMNQNSENRTGQHQYNQQAQITVSFVMSTCQQNKGYRTVNHDEKNVCAFVSTVAVSLSFSTFTYSPPRTLKP